MSAMQTIVDATRRQHSAPGSMSVIAIFRQLTSNSSCKSFALIDLPYLPAQKLPIATPGSFN